MSEIGSEELASMRLSVNNGDKFSETNISNNCKIIVKFPGF